MKRNPIQFLGVEEKYTDPETAAAVFLPIPYEGAVSYGTGAAGAPHAILEASAYLELYDEVLDAEPYRAGIATLSPPDLSSGSEDIHDSVRQVCLELLKRKKFVVLVGGDHSVTNGYFRAVWDHCGPVSAIQIDAHADLRETYEGSPTSHACTMARIRDYTENTLQIGIRSLSVEEADTVKEKKIQLCTMHDFRKKKFDVDAAIDRLPDPVYITFDVDAFDWSVVASTGTPEPGGFLWDEAIDLLEKIFERKNVVACDVVELSHAEWDRNSPFAVAKLIYKIIGFKVGRYLKDQGRSWPREPMGAIT